MRKYFLFVIFVLFFSCASYCAGFTFAVFGDNRDGEKVFGDTLKLIKRDGSIQFAVNTGDMTSSGTKAEYDRYWSDVASSGINIYDVMGNHDIGYFGEGRDLFTKKYGKTYYFFDRGGYRFVIIDNSSSKGLGAAQWKWLKKTLDTKLKLLVFMHEPLFDISGNYPKHVMAPASENARLRTLLVSSGARYVFAGHIHGYGREQVGNIVYIITGGAGAPLYLPHFNGGFYHYVKVSVNGNDIRDEVVKIYND